MNNPYPYLVLVTLQIWNLTISILSNCCKKFQQIYTSQFIKSFSYFAFWPIFVYYKWIYHVYFHVCYLAFFSFGKIPESGISGSKVILVIVILVTLKTYRQNSLLKMFTPATMCEKKYQFCCNLECPGNDHFHQKTIASYFKIIFYQLNRNSQN